MEVRPRSPRRTSRAAFPARAGARAVPQGYPAAASGVAAPRGLRPDPDPPPPPPAAPSEKRWKRKQIARLAGLRLPPPWPGRILPAAESHLAEPAPSGQNARLGKFCPKQGGVPSFLRRNSLMRLGEIPTATMRSCWNEKVYAYANGDPVNYNDPTGLLGSLNPKTKDYICELIAQCAGNLQCVWQKADRQRLNDGWNNPVYRDAENWAYAAGFPGPETTPVPIWLHQVWKKVWPYNTTPYSQDALNAGLEGENHQNESPADLKKWCDGCTKK